LKLKYNKTSLLIMKRKKGVSTAGIKDEFGQGERAGNHGKK
jgi:hypothetical protein